MSFERRHGNVLIRPFTDADADAFHEAVLASVDTVGRVFSWCHAGYSLADAQAWMTRCQRAWESRSDYPFAIVDADTGRLLGSVGINHLHPIHRNGNLGYWVRSGATRNGVGRTAVRLIARFGFETLGLVRLEIITPLENVASQSLAKSVGATLDCVAGNRIVVDGRAEAAHVYALLPPESTKLVRRPYDHVQSSVWEQMGQAIIGVRKREPEAVVAAITFLTEDAYFSGSGYLKEKLWQALGTCDLKPSQRVRLERVALALLDQRIKREFWPMCKAMSRLAAAGFWAEVAREADLPTADKARRARILLAAGANIHSAAVLRRKRWHEYILRWSRAQEEPV